MDTVFIRDLRLDVVIGVFDWERQVHQKISIDLEMANDNTIPAKSDALEDTLDYKAITQRIRQIAEDHQPQLVETLIELIASTIMKEFSIPWLRLSIAKPGAVRGSAAVGVAIERGEMP